MTNKTKILFLVLLSLISVFFAEVISGSMQFPLFDLWGYFVVIPLYGLHVIIILYVIRASVQGKRISFSTLYFGGVLFGLYEAYLTKVLWVGLSEDFIKVFNVSIMDYLVLVFFWHPVFSLIIPVLVFEKIVSKTDYVYQGLPRFAKKVLESRTGLIFSLIVVGFYSAFNGVFQTLTMSELSILVPIILILFIIYKKELHNQYTLDQLLPNKKGIIFCISYLALIYIGLGVFFKPEILTLENQIPIWISYIIFGFIFAWKIRKNSSIHSTKGNNDEVPFRNILLYTFIIMISGLVFVIVLYLTGLKDVMIIATWISWILLGIALLGIGLFSNMYHDE